MPYLVATLIYLSHNYSYYIWGDRSPLTSLVINLRCKLNSLSRWIKMSWFYWNTQVKYSNESSERPHCDVWNYHSFNDIYLKYPMLCNNEMRERLKLITSQYYVNTCLHVTSTDRQTDILLTEIKVITDLFVIVIREIYVHVYTRMLVW